MRWLLLKLTLLLWCALLGQAHAEALHSNTAVTISENTPHFFVHHFDIFTTDSDLTAEEIAAPRFASNWTSYQPGNANSLNNSRTLWLRFDIDVKDTRNSQWLLTMATSSAREARLHIYSKEKETWRKSRDIGLNHPLQDRYYKTRHLTFPLEIEANNRYTVYLQIKADNLVLIPINIEKEEIFEDSVRVELLLLGIFFGALAALLLYNSCLALLLRDRLYLVYCSYIFLVILYQLHLTGLGPMHFWYDIAWINKYGSPLFSSLTFLSAAIFFREMLGLKQLGGWLLHTNTGVIYCWSLIIVSIFFTNNVWDFINLCAFFTTFISVIVSLYLSIYKKVLIAKIYLFAWGLLITTTIIFMLTLNGKLPFNSFTAYSQLGGFLAEMVLLSFALAYRINLDKEQHLQAQEEALELTHRVSEERKQRLHAQKETLELQKNINHELEAQVSSRTEELSEALQRIEIANDELTKLSMTDALTQVANRRFFDESIAKEFHRAARNKNYVAVIFADIDHFKQFNDRYGHAVGDECLQQVAQVLRAIASRPADLLARYGGEEFVFLLPGNSAETAFIVAERAREFVEKMNFSVDGKPIPLTASFGVSALKPSPEDDPSVLLSNADKALYQAKDKGRNRVVIYQETK